MEAIKSFHTHVRFNGKFYGKFAVGEVPDTETLKVTVRAAEWGRAQPARLCKLFAAC